MLIAVMDRFPELVPVVRATSFIVLGLVPIELTLAVFLDQKLLEYRLGGALVSVVFWLSPPALAGLLAVPLVEASGTETSSNTLASGAVCALYASFCMLWTSILREGARAPF